MKLMLDALGGRVYLQGLRTEFLDERGRAFTKFLQERIAGPVAVGPAAPLAAAAFAGARAALESMEAR